jgi:tetratricopeptide (TPR) repeat protein
MNDLVGTTLGQYEIIELIGEGGMANVYRAWQPSLQRYVALKVLAPHLSDDANFVARFHQEAVSAANLTQSNIVTIHDVGNQDGYHYIAMEFIEGGSLEDRIRSQGALSLEQVVDIIGQVGQALDYAHQRGYIHRDIKPANVLIDPEGRAVLTDFGIAKAVSDSGVTAPLTKADSVFGTPYYMSPEQIKDEPIDHRSDLYSLGIVCYEMLAGQVPFDGATTHAILYAQAHNPPPPFKDTNPDVPRSVEAVVNKMLAKPPEARYDNAGAFATALAKAVATGQTSAADEVTVVAQKPPEQAAVTIVSGKQLAPQELQQTGIPTRRKMATLLLTVVGVALIGGLIILLLLDREESVAARLVTAQGALADGRIEQAIEALKDVLERDKGNVEALRGLGEINEAKGEWERAAAWYEKWTQVTPDDAEARLRLGWALFYADEFEQAVAQFSRATSLGADEAEVWEGLGKSYLKVARFDDALQAFDNWADLKPTQEEPLRWLTAVSVSSEDFTQATDYALRWIELAPDEADAFRYLGWAYHGQEKYTESIQAFEKSVKLNPDDADAHRGLALGLRNTGDHAASIPHFLRWTELQPDSAPAFRSLGWAYQNHSDYKMAVEAFNRAAELEPDETGSYHGLGLAYIKLGDSKLAADAFEKWIKLDPSDPNPFRNLGWIRFESGDFDQAVSMFERALELDPDSAGAHRGLAVSLTALEKHDKALPHYVRRAELEPNNAQAQAAAGWAHFRMGQYQEAQNYFTAAISLESDLADAHNGLGWTFLRLGNCTQALVSFEEALNLNPDNQQAWDGFVKCGEQE